MTLELNTSRICKKILFRGYPARGTSHISLLNCNNSPLVLKDHLKEIGSKICLIGMCKWMLSDFLWSDSKAVAKEVTGSPVTCKLMSDWGNVVSTVILNKNNNNNSNKFQLWGRLHKFQTNRVFNQVNTIHLGCALFVLWPLWYMVYQVLHAYLLSCWSVSMWDVIEPSLLLR